VRKLAILAAFLLALPALAQTPPPAPTDPVALVKSFYVPNFIDHEMMPLSPRLAKLLKAAMDNSKKINGPVPGIDFGWSINGQDSEEGTLKSVKVGEPAKQGAKTLVKVTFRNGGPMELQYDLIQTAGKWQVDDIHSIRKPRWTLSKMLEQGAKEKG
jgi:Protein of unknown function (DUF3828)